MKKNCILFFLLIASLNELPAQDIPSPEKLKHCSFLTTGRQTYFILEPGYRLTLMGIKGKDTSLLQITVTRETRRIGEVETRVVEEFESRNGKTIEISRNFLALCQETGDLYYFGEEVDNYRNGKIKNHEGSWVATGTNQAGILIPGKINIGNSYFQEYAPHVAMDRAENISTHEILNTPAGHFTNILKTRESSPLEAFDLSYKYYAPGIGLIKDENLVLTEFGFVKPAQ